MTFSHLHLSRYLALALYACTLLAQAQGTLHKVPTREGITTAVFWEAAAQAKGTVLLFPGGGGGFGPVEGGKPQGRNFLVRSATLFVEAGYNVAILGRPSDSTDLDYADRISEPHLRDVQQVIDFVNQQSALPLWLVGTSRGTVSAAATAIRQPRGIAGLVLASSIVNPNKVGSLPQQNLAAIELPVLLLHHRKDACPQCRPADVPNILRGLQNAASEKLVMVDGGSNPQGEACEATHWHGFVGMEAQAVRIITNWLEAPR